jgi:branched-subunit amino acid aminotransferase/4-amino-4-deoxychorismate lyase
MTTMEQIFSAYQARLSTLTASRAKNPFADGIAWVQGRVTPINEAHIPLLDQGFLHSDLTYDVPSVWDGRFFRLDDHLARLERSCAKMRLRCPLPRAQVKRALCAMVARSGIRDAFVEIIVTRGLRGVRGLSAAEVDALPNSLYMWIVPYLWVMEPEVQLAGSGSAVVARSVHRTPVACMDPTVKNLQWGDLTRGMFEAGDRGAMYPFLTDRSVEEAEAGSDSDANITEGSGFNIVVIKDRTLYTPRRGVLEGVTRESVFECCRRLGVAYQLDTVPVRLAYEADEIFMCTTAGGIMPITSLDGKPVGKGTVGPITSQIWDVYWRLHYEDGFSFAVDYEDETGLEGLGNGENGVVNGKANGTVMNGQH